MFGNEKNSNFKGDSILNQYQTLSGNLEIAQKCLEFLKKL